MKRTNKRRALIKELDRLWSKYVIARDGGRCVLCGSTENVQNGHLLTRSAMSTRWSEINCHAQCARCNARHEENPEPYMKWFLEQYGNEKYDHLLRLHNTAVFFTNDELKQAIQVMKKTLKDVFR